MLIGVTGFAESGKNTIGDVLAQKYEFHISAFADPMRAICAAIDPIVDEDNGNFWRYNEAIEHYGYDAAKKRFPELRQFLQRLGTEAGRDLFGQDHWVDMWRKMNGVQYNEVSSVDLETGRIHLEGWDLPSNMVVCDVRFLNEAAAITEMGGQVWRVERPGVGPQSDHPSEMEQLQIVPDLTIVNDGTMTDLENQVIELMSESELVK